VTLVQRDVKSDFTHDSVILDNSAHYKPYNHIALKVQR
jgi:hypothetical protein